MLKKFNIQTKIALIAGMVFLISYVVVLTIILGSISKSSISQAEILAKETSKVYAEEINGHLNTLDTISKVLDNCIDKNVKSGFLDRDTVIEMQKDILGQYEDIYGISVTFEPNMFDGKDSEYQGRTTYSEQGWFIPYVTRKGSGYHVETSFGEGADMTWYNTPKATKKVYISEPSVYLINGENIALASFVYPILKDDQFFGVISLDYQLDTFQKIIEEIQPMGGAAVLLSKNGMFIANGIDSNHLLKNATEAGEQWKGVTEKTSVGESVLTYGAFGKSKNKDLCVSVPINSVAKGTNWALCIIIPNESIMQEYQRIVGLIIPIAVLIMIVLILVMIFVSKYIAKGIKYAEKHINYLAEGNLDKDVKKEYLGMQDEVGKLAVAMQKITDNLRNKSDAAQKIAEGNLDVTIDIKSENDVLSISMKKMVNTIGELVLEMNQITSKASDGNLEVRGNASAFKGAYYNIVQGVNHTLDAITEPVKEVSSIMKEVSRGNLNVSIQKEYKGDYAVLVNTVNETVIELKNIIKSISDNLSEIAGGNLDIEYAEDFKGDYCIISNSINKILDSLNLLLGDINAASGRVATSSRQVSEGSMQLSQGSTEQSSAIEELSASITQIAAQTKQNASNASQANALALDAKENAENGNESMKSMLQAMNEINEASSNIYKIIKVIDEIAFQTNILSLNAAIEAARAGQYGKGFAVVAEEVRELAIRSADAANETTEYIEGTIKKVAGGTKIANETAKSLLGIVTSSTKVAELVGEIATASNEQATGITQINIGIDQVSKVVQNNSATAEESAAASEEAMSQAQKLNENVATFILRNHKHHESENSTHHERASVKKLPNKKLQTENHRQLILDSTDYGKY